MVPNNNVFLEGSDYDIDKAYAIMYALGRNGIIKGINEGREIIENKTAKPGDISPNVNRLYSEIANIISQNFVDISYSNFTNNNNTLLDNLAEKISKRIFDLSMSERVPLYINNIIEETTNTVQDNNNGDPLTSQEEGALRYAVTRICQIALGDITFDDALTRAKENTPDAMQNFILDNMLSVYRDPRTLMAATDPTTMDPVRNAVDDLDLEAELRSHFNPMTDIFLNQTTSVGKDDIGIAATAQKAFFALSFYYKSLQDSGRNIDSYTQIDLPASWANKIGRKSIVNFVYPGMVLDEVTNRHIIESIRNNTDGKAK
jgi:hypothetical protein